MDHDRDLNMVWFCATATATALMLPHARRQTFEAQRMGGTPAAAMSLYTSLKNPVKGVSK